MKQTLRFYLLITIASLGLGKIASGATDKGPIPQAQFNERDEIQRTYEISPNSHVEVSSISGPVEISTGSSNTAEVHIIRTARNASDLNYRKISVEHGPNSLILRGEQHTERHPQVNHRVILRLPREVNLKIVSISGWVRIGNVDGQAQVTSISGSLNIGDIGGSAKITSISGPLKVGHVRGELVVQSVSGNAEIERVAGRFQVNSVSGSLSATIERLEEAGIRINSISGEVTLRFAEDINADLTATSISGRVELRLQNVVRENDTRQSDTRARIGRGGPPILINSVSGTVLLDRT
jgi:Putative adhesin